MINPNESYVAELGFELATPGSVVSCVPWKKLPEPLHTDELMNAAV